MRLQRLLRLRTITRDNTNLAADAPHRQTLTDDHFLLPIDFERALSLPERKPTDEELQAMQVPDLFEGDIQGINVGEYESTRLRDEPFSYDHIFEQPYNSALNLGTYPDKLWPNGRVPYMLEDRLDTDQRAAIAQAFDEYKNKTCVRFVPRTDSDYDYLYVKKNKHFGCSSYVGRAGGNQTVSLEVGKCFTKGIIAHELMHALGFFHEHSRTDRDANVDIIEANIKPGMLRNFEKYPRKIIDSLEMPYDYESVMHYHKLAFSRNGKPTILPRNSDYEIGQRFRLSKIDAQKVNKLYGCSFGGEEDTRPSTDKATTTTKPEQEKCTDLNAHCEMWADIGHCKWSSKYMNHYCKKSCALCYETTSPGAPPKQGETAQTQYLQRPHITAPSPPITPTETCLDRNLFCGYWARIGECKTESKFMKIFCKRSCGLCDGVRRPKGGGNRAGFTTDEEFRTS